MQKINFLNKPKLSGNEKHKDQDERRLYLVQEIENFIKVSPFFENKNVDVYFFQTGVSSLVVRLGTEESKIILKIQIRPSGPKGEGFFLKTWGENNIPVPYFIEEGYLGEHYYILMKNIETKRVNEVKPNKELFFEMGNLLKSIHKIKADGFGKLNENKIAEYKDFKSWIKNDEQINNQKAYILKHNLLPEEKFGYIENEINFLIENTGNDSSVYCHNDFSPKNVFLTNPLTVFDPVPSFNNPYIDLSRSILKIVSEGFNDEECIKSFLSGYFENEICNNSLLKSSLLFNAYTMIPNLHKTGEAQKIELIKNYLSRPVLV